MNGQASGTAKVAEVWSRLDAVTDPELDEPMTDLGFIERVEVSDEGMVDVAFRLPTYWCSANFAFLMADDIRRQVARLPWVARVRPQLLDHMCASEVNEGVARGLPFQEALAGFGAAGSLDEIREKFRRKAFERRQEAVLQDLRALELSDDVIVAVTCDALERISLSHPQAERQKWRYLSLLAELGHAPHASDSAFVTYEGRPVTAAALAAHMRNLRSVRINMEFSGALCRGLLEARYKEFDPEKDEPTLVDFMLDRVPPRRAAPVG